MPELGHLWSLLLLVVGRCPGVNDVSIFAQDPNARLSWWAWMGAGTRCGCFRNAFETKMVISMVTKR